MEQQNKRMYKKLIALITILVGFTALSKANENPLPATLSDSATVSILTSAPWPEQIYAVYGHSAMRICDPATGVDFVFNYGIFDFDSPNFIYRFTAGETDYIVDSVEYRYYIFQYQMRGVDIYEQTINLKSNEIQRIWEFLLNNIKPENSVYRYNIFFNNCTTKLTDILENNIDGKIVYPPLDEGQKNNSSFRKLVHEHVNKQPWLQFGIDLIIGNGADSTISVKERMFLPIYQKNTFSNSYIQSEDGSKVPLVSHESVIKPLVEQENNKKTSLITPLTVGLFILLITIAISFYEIRKERIIGKIFDTLLFIIAGAAGIIIFFMMYFSVHPCTNPNWNLVWLNPLAFIAGCLFFVKACRKYIYYYHFINFALLLTFVLAWCLIPQQLEIAFIPFITSIALRSGMYVWHCRKIK